MRFVLALVLLAGCRFDVDGIDIGVLGDLATIDLGVVDATQPIGFAPSHAQPSAVQNGASSLTTAHDIDTGLLQIDRAPPPAGTVFVADPANDDWAVLSVKDFDVSVDLSVHGRRGLIVVAVGDAHIAATIHGEARLRVPGPGGQYTGLGVGGDGKSNGVDDSGGGGGGYGQTGGPGGASNANVDGQGGAPGRPYAGDLVGGSGGGMGAGATSSAQACPANGTYSLGGAGGGMIQISAKGAIVVEATAGIDVGGGGGSAGCRAAVSAGGGGGSGGTIWLEAPTMKLLGTLAANGGGGGSGARPSSDGEDGSDATTSSTPASGGASSGNDSGAGGAGGAGAIAATSGARSTNGGGGGGGVGFIRLRTHAVSPQTASTTSTTPAPDLTADF